ncbi:MAG: hypothetical protein U1A78_17185 [Polyangia bacterium]
MTNGFAGYAAERLRNGDTWGEAFAEALAAGESIRNDLLTLLETGTALGQLSAAALLARLDKEAGRSALEALLKSEGVISRASGCFLLGNPVATTAAELLQSGFFPLRDPPRVQPEDGRPIEARPFALARFMGPLLLELMRAAPASREEIMARVREHLGHPPGEEKPYGTPPQSAPTGEFPALLYLTVVVLGIGAMVILRILSVP